MKKYLVGGAVRDQLLGLEVTDRDWVVVGSTPEAMAKAGYKAVGKDFPVFIDPKSGEEFALARTERKTARGYQGFSFNTSPDITLEDDLIRRDLTINAMAMDDNGEIIDPHNGQADLQAGVLRHVSEAFLEDPVRILRLARFAARFNFTVADETLELMRSMVTNGEVDALVAERVWGEMHKALKADHPQRFIQILRECGALARVLPEIDALYGIPQPELHHPEIDTGIHTEMVLAQAANISADPITRFAALVHDLGKAKTPEAKWPSHHGHELLGVAVVKNLSLRLRVPTKFRDLGMVVSEYHLHMHRLTELKASTVLNLLEKTGSLKSPVRAQQFIDACMADSRGRLDLEDRDYPQHDLFLKFLDAANSVNCGVLAAETRDGSKIKEIIKQARIKSIKSIKYDE